MNPHVIMLEILKWRAFSQQCTLRPFFSRGDARHRNDAFIREDERRFMLDLCPGWCVGSSALCLVGWMPIVVGSAGLGTVHAARGEEGFELQRDSGGYRCQWTRSEARLPLCSPPMSVFNADTGRNAQLWSLSQVCFLVGHWSSWVKVREAGCCSPFALEGGMHPVLQPNTAAWKMRGESFSLPHAAHPLTHLSPGHVWHEHRCV